MPENDVFRDRRILSDIFFVEECLEKREQQLEESSEHRFLFFLTERPLCCSRNSLTQNCFILFVLYIRLIRFKWLLDGELITADAIYITSFRVSLIFVSR